MFLRRLFLIRVPVLLVAVLLWVKTCRYAIFFNFCSCLLFLVSLTSLERGPKGVYKRECAVGDAPHVRTPAAF